MNKDLLIFLALGLVGAGAVMYYKDRKSSGKTAGDSAGDSELDGLYAAPPVQDQGQNPGVAAGDTAPTMPTVTAPTAPTVPPSGGNTSPDTLAFDRERFNVIGLYDSRNGGQLGALEGDTEAKSVTLDGIEPPPPEPTTDTREAESLTAPTTAPKEDDTRADIYPTVTYIKSYTPLLRERTL